MCSFIAVSEPTNQLTNRPTDRQTNTRTIAVHLLRSCPICVDLLFYVFLYFFISQLSIFICRQRVCCCCFIIRLVGQSDAAHVFISTPMRKHELLSNSVRGALNALSYVRSHTFEETHAFIEWTTKDQTRRQTDTHTHSYAFSSHLSLSFCTLRNSVKHFYWHFNIKYASAKYARILLASHDIWIWLRSHSFLRRLETFVEVLNQWVKLFTEFHLGLYSWNFDLNEFEKAKIASFSGHFHTKFYNCLNLKLKLRSSLRKFHLDKKQIWLNNMSKHL